MFSLSLTVYYRISSDIFFITEPLLVFYNIINKIFLGGNIAFARNYPGLLWNSQDFRLTKRFANGPPIDDTLGNRVFNFLCPTSYFITWISPLELSVKLRNFWMIMWEMIWIFCLILEILQKKWIDCKYGNIYLCWVLRHFLYLLTVSLKNNNK